MDAFLNSSFTLLSLLLMTALCCYCIRIERDWTTPLSLLCIWIIPSVILDGLYTLITGTYGVREDGRELVDLSLLATSTTLWAVGMLSFTAAYWWSGSRKQIPKTRPQARSAYHKANSLAESRLERNHTKTRQVVESLQKTAEYKNMLPTQRSTFNVIMGVCAVASLAALLGLVVRARSMGIPLVEMSGTRNLVAGFGGGPLLMALQLYKFALLLYMFHQFRAHSINTPAILANALLVCSLDLFIGSRSAMINGFILPAMIGYHVMYRRINLWKMIAPAVLLVLILSPLYRSLTRDIYFSKNIGRSTAEVVSGNFQTVPAMIFGGFEISSLDATMDVVLKYKDSSERHQGATFLMALSSLIPRGFWNDKPFGGASTVYTEEFYPANYGQARAELLTSFVGELFMNFGMLTIPVGFALVGAVYRSLYRWLREGANSMSCLALLVYTTFALRLFNLLRGDTYNFTSQVILNVLVTSLVLMLYCIVNEVMQLVRAQAPRTLRAVVQEILV